MDLPHFLDRLDELETRFPDLADADIRDKLAAMRSQGIENGPVEAASPTAPDTLYHAMYRNKAQSIEDFLADIHNRRNDKEKSYYDFQGKTVTRNDDLVNGHKLVLGHEQALHITQRHPDFTD